MTLKEYVEEQRKRLVAFELWWLENHNKNPDMFPLNLNQGDWDEQEFFYGQSK